MSEDCDGVNSPGKIDAVGAVSILRAAESGNVREPVVAF